MNNCDNEQTTNETLTHMECSLGPVLWCFDMRRTILKKILTRVSPLTWLLEKRQRKFALYLLSFCIKPENDRNKALALSSTVKLGLCSTYTSTLNGPHRTYFKHGKRRNTKQMCIFSSFAPQTWVLHVSYLSIDLIFIINSCKNQFTYPV